MIVTPEASVQEWNGAVQRILRPSTTKGGTLRLVTAAAPDSLDPGRTYYVWVWLLHRMLNRTLMSYPFEPGVEGTRPVPDLAAEPPQVSADARIWTYRMRPGLRYDTGRLIVADDIKHGIERTFDQSRLAGGATTIHHLLTDPANPYRGPFVDGERLDSIQVEDEHTLTFHLRQPFIDLNHLLCQPATVPVPRDLDTIEDYGNDPRCSGPYLISEQRPDGGLRLERNPHWDQATDSIRPALVDAVELTVVDGLDAQDERLMAGDFDISLEGRGIQHAGQRRIMADEALQECADNPETGFLQYVSIQPQIPPFDSVHVRRAIHLAADRLALQEARGGPVTGGSLATQLYPKHLAAQQDWQRYEFGPDQRGDLDAARAELAQAGLADGFRGRIGTQRGKFRLVADALAESVARVGIELEVVELDVATYFRLGVGLPSRVRDEQLGLIVTDWGADYPSEHGYLAPLIDSRMIKPDGGNWNLSETDDPVIDSAIDAAVAEADPHERTRIWRFIGRRVMEQATILPIVHDRTLHWRNPWVDNVLVHPAFGLYDIQAMGLHEGNTR